MDKKVGEYIDRQPLLQKELLNKIRQLIKELIPNAEERMSYGVPAFRLDGKQILYAAFKNHIGFYPEPEIIEKFKKELVNYETTKGTIKFNLDEPIPYDLMRKIIRLKYNL
ncbi:MAG: DUF1801 domain-containing protein [Candidatus Shapirobacteria bacterium]|nr:DUF1801 domain-containing protein [Candidatus Shapirobacteria bacterium]